MSPLVSYYHLEIKILLFSSSLLCHFFFSSFTISRGNADALVALCTLLVLKYLKQGYTASAALCYGKFSQYILNRIQFMLLAALIPWSFEYRARKK